MKQCNNETGQYNNYLLYRNVWSERSNFHRTPPPSKKRTQLIKCTARTTIFHVNDKLVFSKKIVVERLGHCESNVEIPLVIYRVNKQAIYSINNLFKCQQMERNRFGYVETILCTYNS